MRRPFWIRLVVLVVAWATVPMAAQSPAPVLYHQFLNDAGAVCAGCFLDTWASGTTTAQRTYTDSALATENANPIVLDSAGRAIIYLSANNYRFRLQSAASVTIWDRDNVNYVPSGSGNTDVSGTAGEAITAGQVVYLSDGSGALTAGRFYLADADNTYSSTSAPLVGIAVGAIASAGSGTIRLSGRITGLTSLTAGESYYVSGTAGALTGTPPTNARFLGGADTTTTLLLAGETGSVRVPDSDGTHMLRIRTTSDLTADRLLTIVPGDAARTVTLTGDPTLVAGTMAPTVNAALTTPTLTDAALTRPTLTNYRETQAVGTISAGTLAVDLANGNHFTVSLNANITTFTVATVPATTNAATATFIFTADGMARTIMWPTGTVWSGGTAPTMTSTNAMRDIITLYTFNGGTTWFGFINGQNF